MISNDRFYISVEIFTFCFYLYRVLNLKSILMIKKLLLATVAGSVVQFLLGWLIYGLLLAVRQRVLFGSRIKSIFFQNI